MAGNAFTVYTLVAKQPLLRVYVIVAVPALTPVVTPVVLPMLAMPASLLLQVPPPVLLVSVVLKPTHALEVPVMATGTAFTVTPLVALQPVPNV